MRYLCVLSEVPRVCFILHRTSPALTLTIPPVSDDLTFTALLSDEEREARMDHTRDDTYRRDPADFQRKKLESGKPQPMTHEEFLATFPTKESIRPTMLASFLKGARGTWDELLPILKDSDQLNGMPLTGAPATNFEKNPRSRWCAGTACK